MARRCPNGRGLLWESLQESAKLEESETPPPRRRRRRRRQCSAACLSVLVWMGTSTSANGAAAFVQGGQTAVMDPPRGRFIGSAWKAAAGWKAGRLVRKVATEPTVSANETCWTRAAAAETAAARPPIPWHVAFVCDGNTRWSRARGLPLGHAEGARRAVQVLRHARKRGVQCVTLYAFSTENWKRDSLEIETLWSVVERAVGQFRHEALQQQVQVVILGQWRDPRIPSTLQTALARLQHETQHHGGLTVCLALNYGGRSDVTEACRSIAELVQRGDLDVANISEDTIRQYMSTGQVPDPDLIIRTGGERRLSNFLLWDAAYAELYFSDVLWPDFDNACLDQALDWFSNRKRRFGGRNEDEGGDTKRSRPMEEEDETRGERNDRMGP